MHIPPPRPGLQQTFPALDFMLAALAKIGMRVTLHNPIYPSWGVVDSITVERDLADPGVSPGLETLATHDTDGHTELYIKHAGDPRLEMLITQGEIRYRFWTPEQPGGPVFRVSRVEEGLYYEAPPLEAPTEPRLHHRLVAHALNRLLGDSWLAGGVWAGSHLLQSTGPVGQAAMEELVLRGAKRMVKGLVSPSTRGPLHCPEKSLADVVEV